MYYFMKVSNHTPISKLLLTKGYALVRDNRENSNNTIDIEMEYNVGKILLFIQSHVSF